MTHEIDLLEFVETDQVPIVVSEERAVTFGVKRCIDILGALLALIVSFPIMALIAILIKLDSRGPVIFAQTRVGGKRVVQNGHAYWQKNSFRCLKFRTMVNNCDPTLHQQYIKAFMSNDVEKMKAMQGGDTNVRKLTRDPRITRIGHFLRKSSLDELPQFWNIFMGDMSLVGPRPAIPYEVEDYLPWHMQRLQAKPGLTGLWQVTARSSADFDEMVRLDIEYIRRQSTLLDLKILLLTPWTVITSKGAV